jgi:hypothetical protein
MVPLINNSPLGLSRTFRTPLKGDVLSCPAIHPSYGKTFCDIVRLCPVLSGREYKVLKFYIRLEIRTFLLSKTKGRILSVYAYAFKPRQMSANTFFSHVIKAWRAEILLNRHNSWGARLWEVLLVNFNQCVENSQNMRVAVSCQNKRIGAV